ncbi:PilW family protein [Acinetobacter haemolyticus]|uniref:PilW family protein n=1 Tax=Acinetobacter haemolyticus TaxID=29430 RepID=UPI0034CE2EA5
MKAQVGFTLIELMLALALGLVITASATLLFFTGQRSLAMQQGLTDIQDNANFGLNYIMQDLVLANLNAPDSVINDTTAYSGIVLTSVANADTDPNTSIPLSNLDKLIRDTSVSNVNLLTRSVGAGMSVGTTTPAWTGISNVQMGNAQVFSDQLTMQYTPQYRVERRAGVDWFVGGFDCEGNRLDFRVEQNPANATEPFGQQVVVQRYFLREDANRNENEPNQPLALVCDAGFYAVDDPEPNADGSFPDKAMRNFGDAGQIIMKRVDHFRALLSVQNENNTQRYISIDQYMQLPTPRPRIVGLQIGALVRSSQSVGNDAALRADQPFTVLDQTVTVRPHVNETGDVVPTATRYIRHVVSQTIALRNSIGERGI